MTKIINWKTKETIIEDENLTIRELVEGGICLAYTCSGEADLRGADLRRADLRDAYLRRADLRDADLRDAYLRGAYLESNDIREGNERLEGLLKALGFNII
tara:strand:+ start:368 stop:670 length:303 start_codon:yes stop_codon:yes gene_type:complete